jgi:hypothetical protein
LARIGLEMAEALQKRGLRTSVVELLPTVMSVMDREFGVQIAAELLAAGLSLVTGVSVKAVHGADHTVELSDGRRLRAQFDLLLLKHSVLFVGCSLTDPSATPAPGQAQGQVRMGGVEVAFRRSGLDLRAETMGRSREPEWQGRRGRPTFLASRVLFSDPRNGARIRSKGGGKEPTSAHQGHHSHSDYDAEISHATLPAWPSRSAPPW